MANSESILRKIRKLMSLTVDAGCTEEEAKAAAEAVDRLMGEYDINVDDLTVRSTSCNRRPIASGERCHPARFIIHALTKFTDTKAWVNKDANGNEVFTIFGLEPDLDVAEYLFWLFKRSIDREIGLLGIMDPEWGEKTPAQDREARNSFGIGMANRLSERLGELKSKRDFNTQQETGRSLVVVKGAIVTEEFAKLNLKLRASRSTVRAKDGAAYNRGRSAGDKVSINQGVGSSKQTHIR